MTSTEPECSPQVRQEPDSANAGVAPPAASADLLGYRLLIVDDNADLADILRVTLELLGATCWATYDGHTALGLLAAANCDAVLCDIGMPVMDGFAVAEAVRKRFGADGPKLIAITAWSDQETRQRAMASGFDHYLVKPVAPPVIAALIRQLVPARRP